MTEDELNGFMKRVPGLAWLRRRLIATKTFQALVYARLTFFTEPAYCTVGSSLRLTACAVGLGRFVKTVRVRLLPFEVDVWLRPGTADIDTLIQVWSHREYDIRIAAPATVIDGGANIGLTSVFFALTWPGCCVLSVEPEPRNFELLERNTRDLPNVRIVNAALWESAQELTVVDRGIGVNAYYVVADRAGDPSHASSRGTSHASSRGTTVDGLCDEEGWGAIDLLKLDIEGAEVEVLRSSARWIDRVGVLVVELHDRFRAGCSEAFRAATGGFGEQSAQGELEIASRGRSHRRRNAPSRPVENVPGTTV